MIPFAAECGPGRLSSVFAPPITSGASNKACDGGRYGEERLTVSYRGPWRSWTFKSEPRPNDVAGVATPSVAKAKRRWQGTFNGPRLLATYNFLYPSLAYFRRTLEALWSSKPLAHKNIDMNFQVRSPRSKFFCLQKVLVASDARFSSAAADVSHL